MQALSARQNPVRYGNGSTKLTGVVTTVYLDVPGTMYAWDVYMIVLTVEHVMTSHASVPSAGADSPDYTASAKLSLDRAPIGPPLNIGLVTEWVEGPPGIFVFTNRSPVVLRQEFNNPLRMTPRSELAVEFSVVNAPADLGAFVTGKFGVALYGDFIATHGRL